MPDVQLLLPGDTRKQRKQTKQIFLEKGKNLLCRWDLSRHSLTFISVQRLKWVCVFALPYDPVSQ